jgi:cytochrome bd ubiquinol oxidase subunit II
MDSVARLLPQVWFFILGLFLFLYITLDGFDLGVGILSLTSSDEERRSTLMSSLGNVWDANETQVRYLGLFPWHIVRFSARFTFRLWE